MDKRMVIIGVVAAVVVIGLGFATFVSMTMPQPSTTPHPTLPGGLTIDIADPNATPAGMRQVDAKDGTFAFSYPGGWNVQDATPIQGSGQFGPITQAWTVSSFSASQPGGGGIPEGTAKIDIEVQTSNPAPALAQVVDCGMKTESCTDQTINGVVYKKSSGTLNTGMTSVIVGAVKDGKVVKASALINGTSDQSDLSKQVEDIVSSFLLK